MSIGFLILKFGLFIVEFRRIGELTGWIVYCFSLGSNLVFLLKNVSEEWMPFPSIFCFLLPPKVLQHYFIDPESICSAWRMSLVNICVCLFLWLCSFFHRKAFFQNIGWSPNFHLHPLLTSSGFSKLCITSAIISPWRNNMWQLSELFTHKWKNHTYTHTIAM